MGLLLFFDVLHPWIRINTRVVIIEAIEAAEVDLQGACPAQGGVHINVGNAQFAGKIILRVQGVVDDAVETENGGASAGSQRLLRCFICDETCRAEDQAELAVQIAVGKG